MAKNGLLIDYQFCTGCRTCEVACKKEHEYEVGQWGIKLAEFGPWKLPGDKWELDYIPFPTELCDLCGERVAKGKAPTCVKHCQAQVMKFGPVEELAQDLIEKPRQVLFAPK